MIARNGIGKDSVLRVNHGSTIVLSGAQVATRRAAGACALRTRRIKCGPHHPAATVSEQGNTGATRKEQGMKDRAPARRVALGRSFVGAVLAAMATVLLAGCSNFGGQGKTYTCPTATTVPELQTLAEISNDGTQVQSAGRINTIDSSCEKDGAGIVTYLTIDFSALRTTRAVGRLRLPYFVAMADSSGKILGKRIFVVGFNFKPDTPVAKTTDNITARLPLSNPQLGNIYTVIVGFQLNQSQLDFNRAHLQ